MRVTSQETASGDLTHGPSGGAPHLAGPRMDGQYVTVAVRKDTWHVSVDLVDASQRPVATSRRAAIDQHNKKTHSRRKLRPGDWPSLGKFVPG